MKFTIIFLTTLLLSLTAFSYPGTDSSLHLSHKVGKLVAYDLVSYDSLKRQDSLTLSILNLTVKESQYKDTVIKTFKTDNETFKNQIQLYKSKDSISRIYIDNLSKNNKKLTSGIKITSIGCLIGLSYILFSLIHH